MIQCNILRYDRKEIKKKEIEAEKEKTINCLEIRGNS